MRVVNHVCAFKSDFRLRGSPRCRPIDWTALLREYRVSDSEDPPVHGGFHAVCYRILHHSQAEQIYPRNVPVVKARFKVSSSRRELSSASMEQSQIDLLHDEIKQIRKMQDLQQQEVLKLTAAIKMLASAIGLDPGSLPIQ